MWKQVVGYEGYYEVSDDGQVRSVDRAIQCKDGVHHIKGRVMKQSLSVGYYVVNLRKPGSTKIALVHRLVADAFLPNPERLQTVNHIDGCKTNNHVSNLEWASYAGNNQHAYDTGLHSPWGYRIDQYDVSGNFISSFPNMYAAARAYGVTPGCISHCVHGRNQTACGYVWKQVR